MKDGALTGMYYDYAMAAPYMAGAKEKDTVRVLVLGNGTGTYATQCLRYFDNMEIEGVEIDGKIMKLADQYFEQPKEVNVTEFDGRAFLNATGHTYDVIMVDAFRDITIPFQMSSLEFFELVKAHLAPDGVMVVNLNMRGDEPGDINHYLCDTISHVFDEVYTADVPNTTNRELFAASAGTQTIGTMLGGEANNGPAADSAATGSAAPAARIISRLASGITIEQDAQLRALMETVYHSLAPYEAGDLLLTDDRAPVEMLGIRQIDAIIRDEIDRYRDQIRAGDFSF